MDCRRPAMGSVARNLSSGLHLGLWLDRGLGAQPDDSGNNRDALQKAINDLLVQLETANCKPFGYDAHVGRLRGAAEELKGAGQAVVCDAKVLGRMIVGLGAKNAMEFGIHLDHTWGVPVIPGSSLKGIAAATAHKLAGDEAWRKPGKSPPTSGDSNRVATQFEWLFGTTENRGAVQFWDAWWIPDSANKEKEKIPVHRDVMTVHHADYYQGKLDSKGGIAPPSDMDDPNPIAFLSVSGTYLIVVEGDPEWAGAAMKLLHKGLIDLGIGAKTNAGYGRMALDWSPPFAATEHKREHALLAANVSTQPAKPQGPVGPTAEEREAKGLAALVKFKADVQRAKDSERPTVIKGLWGTLGVAETEAARWFIDDYCKLDIQAATTKFNGRDWFKPIRAAYLR